MELRKFGPLRQLVSVIGQGTWYIDAGNRSSVIAALRRGLDLRMNHIDTAGHQLGSARITDVSLCRSGTVQYCLRSRSFCCSSTI
jgi:hypothetical protein